MPITKPFIRRAICQSGALNSQGHQADGGIAASESLFSKLGIKMGDVDAFRKVSVEDLIKTEAIIRTEQVDFSIVKKEILAYPPFIDGNIVPEHPLIAINNGASRNVDLIIGNNLNEWTFFSMLNPQLQNIDWDELFEYINTTFSRYNSNKKEVEEVINLLKHSRVNPTDVLNAIYTELEFSIPSKNVAEAKTKNNFNTYMYIFNYKTPALEGHLGAIHALKISLIFGTLENIELGYYPKRDEINTRISEQVMDSWISFARSGSPNHEGIPEWPTYDIENRYTILFGSETKIEKDPLHNERLAIKK